MLDPRGFSLVTFLLALPLILSVLLGLLLATGLTFRQRQQQHQCQKAVLKIQMEQARTLRQLLQLNQQAVLLQKQRRLADRVFRQAMASGHPYAIGVAKAALLAVKTKQLALRTRQQSLLSTSKTQMSLSLKKMEGDLHKIGTRSQVVQRPNGLPVVQRESATGSPTFHVLPAASQRHKLDVKWSWNFPRPWLHLLKSLNFQEQTLKGHCSATLRKRSMKWSGELSVFGATMKAAQ